MVIVDNPPREVVERGKKRRGPVSRVVVRLRADVADAQGKPWLRAFERLALRLLVAAEHDRLFGRI